MDQHLKPIRSIILSCRVSKRAKGQHQPRNVFTYSACISAYEKAKHWRAAVQRLGWSCQTWKEKDGELWENLEGTPASAISASPSEKLPQNICCNYWEQRLFYTFAIFGCNAFLFVECSALIDSEPTFECDWICFDRCRIGLIVHAHCICMNEFHLTMQWVMLPHLRSYKDMMSESVQPNVVTCNLGPAMVVFALTVRGQALFGLTDIDW